MKHNGMKHQRTKKQWAMFLTGLLAMLTGMGILGFFGIRKVCRMVQKEKLIRENISVEIPDLDIYAPVLEGTGQEILSKAAGHFPDTGAPGSGNFCIAAHSSTIYKEYFNNLRNAETGMHINLYTPDKAQCFVYIVSEIRIVEPNEIWILDDFGDTRVTLVTCTDDGTQRLVVVAQADSAGLS